MLYTFSISGVFCRLLGVRRPNFLTFSMLRSIVSIGVWMSDKSLHLYNYILQLCHLNWHSNFGALTSNLLDDRGLVGKKWVNRCAIRLKSLWTLERREPGGQSRQILAKQYIQKCLYVRTYSKYLSEYIFFISFNIKGTWLQCIICVSIISILQIVWGIATDVYKFYPAQPDLFLCYRTNPWKASADDFCELGTW